MLGYSDLLLLSQPLSPDQNELAAKIGQQARRTKSLVASLLSFAKQSPATMGPVDLNTLLRTAVKLSQPQWQALKIEVRTQLPQELLLVRGDSNQLLQVCVQIVNDALHVIDQQGGRSLNIDSERKDGLAIVNVFSTSLVLSSPKTSAENAAETEADSPETFSGLGLNACQGILQQHHGRILCRQHPDAGINVRIELPLIPAIAGKSPEPGVPVMWQPQPFA